MLDFWIPSRESRNIPPLENRKIIDSRVTLGLGYVGTFFWLGEPYQIVWWFVCGRCRNFKQFSKRLEAENGDFQESESLLKGGTGRFEVLKHLCFPAKPKGQPMILGATQCHCATLGIGTIKTHKLLQCRVLAAVTLNKFRLYISLLLCLFRPKKHTQPAPVKVPNQSTYLIWLLPISKSWTL